MNRLYTIGIDEAGRGPWAGPVVAGGWMIESSIYDHVLDSFDKLNDSKILSPQVRENIFLSIEASQYRNECQFAFSYRDAADIDRTGIREANRQCMQDVILSLLQFVEDTDYVEIFIDGRDNYRFDLGGDLIGYDFVGSSRDAHIMSGNERIKIYYRIRGDRLYKHISAASVVAKVTRDRMMRDFHEDFPEYEFDTHKGYGTRKHKAKILHYGISPIHRKTYEPVKSLILDSSSV